jgi:hypothetical protein
MVSKVKGLVTRKQQGESLIVMENPCTISSSTAASRKVPGQTVTN